MVDCSFDTIRACGAVPRWCEAGFIQLKLNHKQRLHFWHPDFPKPTPEEDIHSHRYSFCSRIIAGEMIHETWSYDPDGSGRAECLALSCQADQPAQTIPLSTGTMTMSGRYTMPAGASYFFPAAGFHRTITRRAVALLCRGEIERDTTLVIRPVGAACPCASCASRALKSETECWAIIRDLLR